MWQRELELREQIKTTFLKQICLINTCRRNLISCHHSRIKWSNLCVCEAQIVITTFTQYRKSCTHHQFYYEIVKHFRKYTYLLSFRERDEKSISCLCIRYDVVLSEVKGVFRQNVKQNFCPCFFAQPCPLGCLCSLCLFPQTANLQTVKALTAAS